MSHSIAAEPDRIAPQTASLPSLSSGPCWGRTRELETLGRLWADGRAVARGQLAVVYGPQGIGKSRLLDALARRLDEAGRSDGALVITVRAAAAGDGPLRPIQQILDRVAARLAGSDLAGAAAFLARRLATPEALDPARAADGRLALFERLAAFLADLSTRRPLALLVDDLDRADAPTRALVAHLAETRCAAPELALDRERFRGLVVVTSRDPAAASPWSPAVDALALGLGPLDETAVREVLQSPEVIAHLMRACDGSPERLIALVLGAGAPPVGEAALGRISPPARALVEALAVHERPAPVERLRRLVALDEAELRRAAEELVCARLAEWVDDRLTLARATPATNAVIAALAPAERARLDERIGRALVDEGDAGDLGAAADHLLRAGAGELAVDTALAAGQRLAAGFAHERAIALYRRAHGLTARESVRADLEARLVELESLVGDYAGALADAERIVRRAPDDPANHRRVGQLHVLRDELPAARAALDRARALAGGDLLEQVRVLAAGAELDALAGDHAAARRDAEAGLALLATLAPAPDGEAAALGGALGNALGKVHLAEGAYEAAASIFAANVAAARVAGLPQHVARGLINQGIVHLRQGAQERAAACYQAALKVAEAAGDHRNLAFCLQNLGVLAHWSCDYASAQRYFREAIAAFQKLGQRARVAWLALDLASLYLDVGALDRAVPLAALAGRLVDGEGGGAGAGTAAVTINRAIIAGRIALERGDLDEAAAHLRAARDRAAASAQHERFADATLHLARLELERGDVAGAARLVDEVSASSSAAGESSRGAAGTRARAQLLLGRVALAQRDFGRARRALLAALDGFTRLDDLDGQRQAQRRLVELAQRGGDRREADRRERLAVAVEEALRARIPEELLPATPLPSARALPPARPAAWQRHFGRIIGRHQRLAQVFQLVDKVAPHDSLVLIRGESGTGKELVADAIHAASTRAGRPFVKVNCGALVESLLLSELFGHERGAFTGAVRRKKGHFETADGGTIFLDEIGDISPKTQVALLRVLQERQIERVGSCVPIRVDVRILCATNRDLEAMVRSGQFREDLYYRLKGIQIELPALRERADDIPLLADYFLERVADERGAPRKKLSPDALAALERHPWPGNVRELENVIRSVSLFAEGAVIELADVGEYSELLDDAARPGTRAAGPAPVSASTAGADGTLGAWRRIRDDGMGLRELQDCIEIDCITRALDEAGGNITRAAELLKMKRPRLSQLIKEYGLAPSSASRGDVSCG